MSLDQNSFTQALRIAMMMGRTPRTPFLESQQITKEGSVTAVSTAVQRLDMVRKATRLYIAAVVDGVGRVYYSFPKKKMAEHRWVPAYFSEPADDIAIAFNGIAHSNGQIGREFITDNDPWVFWVKNGECRGRILNHLGETIFASDNCTKVDAICDLSKDSFFEGLGFVLFMIINGQIFYRQLLDGNWTDAELVQFGPENVVWVDIQAFRTWDYRIGLQAVTSTGDVYEFFSKYRGFSYKLSDHMILTDVQAVGNFMRIYMHEFQETEHISISAISAGAPYGGFYQINTASIVNAYNIEDENEDWGKKVVIIFDKHVKAEDIAVQYSTFVLTDSRSVTFTCIGAALQSDGKTVILSFNDFNNASGQCSIGYTPGTIKTMADYSITATSYSFTPQNLVGPSVPEPEPDVIRNIAYRDYVKGDGAAIEIVFTQLLINSLENQNSKFEIQFYEPAYTTDGPLVPVTRTPIDCVYLATVDSHIDLEDGSMTDMEYNNGALTLAKESDE